MGRNRARYLVRIRPTNAKQHIAIGLGLKPYKYKCYQYWAIRSQRSLSNMFLRLSLCCFKHIVLSSSRQLDLESRCTLNGVTFYFAPCQIVGSTSCSDAWTQALTFRWTSSLAACDSEVFKLATVAASIPSAVRFCNRFINVARNCACRQRMVRGGTSLCNWRKEEHRGVPSQQGQKEHRRVASGQGFLWRQKEHCGVPSGQGFDWRQEKHRGI